MEVERTPEVSFSRILRWLAVVIVGMLLASAWGWLAIPADKLLPVHWNIKGRADGWANRDVALMQMPVLAISFRYSCPGSC